MPNLHSTLGYRKYSIWSVSTGLLHVERNESEHCHEKTTFCDYINQGVFALLPCKVLLQLDSTYPRLLWLIAKCTEPASHLYCPKNMVVAIFPTSSSKFIFLGLLSSTIFQILLCGLVSCMVWCTQFSSPTNKQIFTFQLKYFLLFWSSSHLVFLQA